MIKIVSYKESPMYSQDHNFVNTTSRSNSWGRGLSPFLLGPCDLYVGAPCLQAKNVENAWQYAKVYSEHTDADKKPTEEYFKWAKIGFLTQRGIRYPMGKGVKPLFSWWDGEKLGYIEARKRIYIPLYTKALRVSKAYKTLKEFYFLKKNITLWDFDGYDHESLQMTLDDVINCESKTMGHAFVIKKCLLEDVGELNG